MNELDYNELECSLVPKNCENFLALAASGYYNGTIFHRNIKGFLIQGGDPTGTGKGGESIWGSDEFIPDEFTQELSHDRRGIVSMAKSAPDKNASQFFITYGRQPHLNNDYTVIGKVIHGWDTLDAMERVPVSGKKFRPTREIKIEDITIHANPIAMSSTDT